MKDAGNLYQELYMNIKDKFGQFIIRLKHLEGDPHHIGLGMGLGVFACVTPTLPFQTFLAIALSFIFKGSRAAALLGSLVVAPGIPFFYLASYNIGFFFLNDQAALDIQSKSIMQILQNGLDVFCAIMAGGIITGIPCGIIAYFVTKKIFINMRRR